MKIVNLTLAGDKPRWEKTPDGFLRCTARILAERVMPYGRKELNGCVIPEYVTSPRVDLFVPGEEMACAEALRSLEGVPIVAGDHTWLTPEIVNTYGMGNVAGAPRIEGPYTVVDLLVTNPEAIQAIESGEIGEISAGYHSEIDFTPGEWNGQQYDALQKGIRYNHIAVIPAGSGRAGADVRIINKKKEEVKNMPIKVKLANTGAYIQVENEEDATAVEKESQASGASLEKLMADLEKNAAELAEVQSQNESLKGELSTYKEKLDQLLSEEAVEHAAEGMVAEAGEAEEIIENSTFVNEKGEEDEKKKEEVMNSIRSGNNGRPFRGTALHSHILNSLGVKTDGMSPDALRGAFKAQNQLAKMGVGKKKTISGTKLTNQALTEMPQQRSAHQRLGFK